VPPEGPCLLIMQLNASTVALSVESGTMEDVPAYFVLLRWWCIVPHSRSTEPVTAP